ncbi:MAG: site-2 protease family protein [Chloroflexi bacterium]|nr:site-2 protease family protein [Chloroflexota bacterium]
MTILAFSIALIIGITVHEFSHAISAYRLGDPTAKNLGRVTLDPRAHLDRVGTLLIFLAGFGWGKPTPVDPRYFKGNGQTGMALVSIAGPISNLMVAGLLAITVHAGVFDSPLIRTGLMGFLPFSFASGSFGIGPLEYFVGSLITWNFLLAAFNLIPIAPLDGFKIVLGVLPRRQAISWARLEQYGPAILMVVIMLQIAPFGGILGNLAILSRIINPLISFFSYVLLGW